MISFLFTWYNLPFLIALAGCLVFALLQLFGGASDGGDAELEAEVDGSIEGDAEAGAANSGGVGGSMLAALGVGKLPLTIVIMSLLGSFGASGLLANTLISNLLGGYPAWLFLLSLLIAGGLSLLITARSSRGLAAIAADSTQAVGFAQLIGLAGVVSSNTISPTYGRVSVRDRNGTTHTVYAIIEAGELPAESHVALVAYDQAQRRYIARRIESA